MKIRKYIKRKFHVYHLRIRIIPGIVCVAVLFFLSCSSLFPTNYDRIDAERVRILDYIYNPAEAAPGERVKVFAVFAGAGDSLNPEDITLSEVLGNAGYTTCMISDTYHYFAPSMNFHRSFDCWEWVRGQESDPWR